MGNRVWGLGVEGSGSSSYDFLGGVEDYWMPLFCGSLGFGLWALSFRVLELGFRVGVLGSLEARVLRNREVVV